MTPVKIGIVGCTGRMGRILIDEVRTSTKCWLAGGTARTGSTAIGNDIAMIAGGAPTGAIVTDDPCALFTLADLVIDFTTPAATMRHVRLAVASGKPIIVGTTGLSADDRAMLATAAAAVPIVWAPNMSLAFHLVAALVRQAAAKLGPGFDIEILELHHKHKVDAPSGTAIALGEAAAQGRGVALSAVAVRARDGHTGARLAGTIGFGVLRGGAVVGEHEVKFFGDDERIEICHRASSRRIYAQGAVRAALWLHGRPPGLYDIADVLELG
jgi:4-hydroxy-tetrahydrodipicolinate reductase